MYVLSDRCKELRRLAVEVKSLDDKIEAARNVWFLKGEMELAEEDLSNQMLIASGLASVMKNARPVIQEDELIVGYNFGHEDSIGVLWGSDDNHKILEENGFSNEQIEWYFENAGDDFERFELYFSNEKLSEQDSLLGKEWAAIGRCIADNHTVLGYAQILEHGFSGMLDIVNGLVDKNGEKPIYKAMQCICEAGCVMGGNYAKEAERLLANETDEKRRLELQEIINTCNQVPKNPAKSFLQAVQSLWFAHIVNTWEDGINANSLGRLDQILYPYYKKDVENGLLTKQQAFEIICCLWIKLYRDYDVQQSCVGGCDKDGNCAVNELSFMMLDATEQLDFIRCLSVRYDQNTPRKFLRRALEVVGHVQKGIPFFFNDDVMIPALTAKGIHLTDARDYTQIGCVETVIPGKSNPHAVSGETNLLKALEYALADGYSIINNKIRPGSSTGDPLGFTTYELLKAAVFDQMRNILESTVRKIVFHCNPAAVYNVKPYKSMLTQGCLENGVDFNDKGAKYDYYQVMLGGIPNLADSLAAIKKLVYDEKRYTLEALIEQLKNDWPDELARLDFLNKAPKFGNDIESVDKIAYEIMDFCCDYLDELSTEFGIACHAQPFTFLWMVDHGHHTAASPDGRKSGEIIAYSMSPMQGRDFNGFTALLNSIAGLPTKKAPGTTSAIVEVDPKLFTDNNIDRFVDILLAASAKGLCNVQFNTIDAETLIAAQKEPDKYRNIAVRVSGFSQKFYLLNKEMQDHIIGRTKHACL